MAQILDDETFEVAVGLFGGVKATAKHRSLSIKYSAQEKAYLMQGIAEYEKRGFDAGSEEVLRFIHDSAEAVFHRGRSHWNVFFATLDPASHVAENLKS